MKPTVRILLVEDDDDDARLVELSLRRAPFDIDLVRAVSEAEVQAALASPRPWDVVLTDYSLPQLNASMVIAAVRALSPELPIIVVSGTLGEERAVGLLKEGANDFILKDRRGRLASAIERELESARMRREQRQLREQVMITDRMASLGMVTSGVTHEINNPLGVLLGTLGLIEQVARNAPSPERDSRTMQQLVPLISDALGAADRIRQIARDVRVFSRFDRGGPPSPVNPRTVIASSLRLARMQLQKCALVEERLADTPVVVAHEGKLAQVLLNLFINAAQAMSETSAESNRLLVETRMRGDLRAEIVVSDNGCGIADEDLARIFDPFFTTKPAGLGTGLGLSICKRIIEDLAGELLVESEKGRGTTFRIVLPTLAGK